MSEDEVIILAVASPRTGRHVPHFHKLPIGHIGGRQSQVIPYRWRNIQPGAVIKIWFGTLVSEDVLKVVRAKWTAILPLRIARAISLTNGDPAMSAYRLARPRVGLFKPWNYQRGFRFELTMRYIVVRQRTVKGILLGNKSYWNVIAPGTGIGRISAAVILGPIKVPRTFVIWDRIISSCFFPNPKHSGHNTSLPRITLHRRT